ncbi:calcium-binding protein [Rubellimicrobium roseum]|uniref:Calcium-binding protein n=1 Tax=Rubellimicrobium roseum TaxID=687525 RepID=A0A5C4NAG2_9RHOB|nr:calcium-binding protein [Rubellimicrobium roseum]
MSGGAGADFLYGGHGKDRLHGAAGHDLLQGEKGDDILDGGLSNDRLSGGVGRDRLTGGLGHDAFVFTARSEGRDIITDFHNRAGDNDLFRIDASGFGGGLVEGRTLAASQFRARADNVAQDADDRFIFRTTDKTLWFDSNGNESGGRTLLADLQTDATVTYADILLV